MSGHQVEMFGKRATTPVVTVKGTCFEQSFIAHQFGERSDTGFFWMDLSNQEDDSTLKFSNGAVPEDPLWAEDHPGRIVEWTASHWSDVPCHVRRYRRECF
ncbi:hypothetical protein CAPTEDRAFT_194269 [Capitella teleta]|uniref:C-type lectin domain-containing protein n=1 Tax=Capitella teleta TaxID=283909 RepID=R7TJ29_CAPTE|nr:hypothetical protein CAPTEDRAFT_194269 [Capitella teleta]|eukprot:ELT93502.1 hypothetical protein CAPTEDRAFT_194269 [Capitella teleta]